MLDGSNTDIHNDPYLIGIDMKKLGESLNAGLIDTVLEFSKRINDGRGRYYVLAKCQEELGVVVKNMGNLLNSFPIVRGKSVMQTPENHQFLIPTKRFKARVNMRVWSNI